MSQTYIPSDLRRLMRQRSGERCEYWLIPESVTFTAIEQNSAARASMLSWMPLGRAALDAWYGAFRQMQRTRCRMLKSDLMIEAGPNEFVWQGQEE